MLWFKTVEIALVPSACCVYQGCAVTARVSNDALAFVLDRKHRHWAKCFRDRADDLVVTQ